MRKINPAIPLVIAAALVIAGVGAAALSRGQITPIRYFPETGHLLSDPFLSYFDQHGGQATLGLPLTDAYTLPDGTLAQTFQRAQLVMTARGIRPGPLSQLLKLGTAKTGSAVAPEFAAEYKALGGEDFFGPPFGDAHQENGLLVQDFERARLTVDAQGRVRLADLGELYLSIYPPPPQGQAEIRLRGTPTPPPAIQASASVERPTVAQGSEQTIYLLVEDTAGKPVEGARSVAMLRYNTGTAEVEMPPTDASGVASARFLAPPASPGSRVIVQMHVLVGEAYITVETTYFQWW